MGRGPGQVRPDLLVGRNALVREDGAFRHQGAHGAADGGGGERLAGRQFRSQCIEGALKGGRAQLGGQPLQRGPAVLALRCQRIENAGGRSERTAQPRVAEEGDRRPRLHQHQPGEPAEQRLRWLREIGQPLDGGDAASARQTRPVAVAEHADTGGGAQAAGRAQAQLQ